MSEQDQQTPRDEAENEPERGGKPDQLKLSAAEWARRLTSEQFQIMRMAGTEQPFTGPHWDRFSGGLYTCVGCEAPLFHSDTKFDAGCGWPSFFEAVTPGALSEIEDNSHFMVRTEIRCAKCDSHLATSSPTAPSQPASATA